MVVANHHIQEGLAGTIMARKYCVLIARAAALYLCTHKCDTTSEKGRYSILKSTGTVNLPGTPCAGSSQRYSTSRGPSQAPGGPG